MAVTGLGAISALGPDVPALWRGALAGTCGIAPITDLPAARIGARLAAQVRGFDPHVHFAARRASLLDRVSQLAIVAAREAMAGAGLVAGDLAALGARVAVILGAASGQLSTDEAYYALYAENAARVHPFSVPRIMPNAPAVGVSMEFSARGPCFAVASACASSTHAIGLAFDMIRSGRVDAALTGGADASIVVGYIKAWEGLRVLSPDGCRPFSRDRNGLVLGEGAGIVVLEEWERARARGASIQAELVGFGMNADASDLTAPNVDGAAAAMRAALADAGLAPSQIGYVNAHGTGTRLNDATESAALGKVFGTPPPTSSSKSQFGHCLNAAGGLEFVMTVLALREQTLPPTLGFREPDAECVADCVPLQARPAAFSAALSNSFAFGGLNAVLCARAAG